MLKYLRLGNKRTKLIWWALVVITVITFVGGFIFLFGAGLFDSNLQAQMSGAAGTVAGEPISRTEYQNAVAEQRELYRRQFNTQPADQDARFVEAQAWRGLVTQRLLRAEAKSLGLKAHDREVLLSLQTQPPSLLASAPEFQTDGKFDPQKYQQAMRDPGNNWAPFENMVRSQLPIRKLQERLMSSIKLSQPELLEAFRNRFERVSLTVAHVQPSPEGNVPPPSEADLDRLYAAHKGRFVARAGVELEVLNVPKAFSEEEVRVARQTAESLVGRARGGEDFAGLARDYSEGPGADQGGVVTRPFQPSDFGPELAPKMMVAQAGQVMDPVREGGRFLILKVLEVTGVPPAQTLKVAQIVVKVRPGELALQEQHKSLRKLRDRARRVGLGKAATEAGFATGKTPFFDLSNTPQQLYSTPEAVDWAIGAKLKAVSPVFEGIDEFVVVQVSNRRSAGPLPKAEVLDQLRQIGEAETRTKAVKPKADAIAQSLATGRTLEEAAVAAGAVTFQVEGMSRQQPDPRLGMTPEVVGAAFATSPGRTVGPIETVGGWFFARLDRKDSADSTFFNDQMRGQMTREILNQRQQEFFANWISELRRKTKVEDLRTP